MDEITTRLEELEAKRSEITAEMKKINKYVTETNNPFYCKLRAKLYKIDLEIIDLKEKQKLESEMQKGPRHAA